MFDDIWSTAEEKIYNILNQNKLLPRVCHQQWCEFAQCASAITLIMHAQNQKIGKSNNLKIFGSK
jgi:hypothetical protein